MFTIEFDEVEDFMLGLSALGSISGEWCGRNSTAHSLLCITHL